MGPDTPDDPGDGAPQALGLFVEWRADPALPGQLTDELTVSEATFQVDHLQIQADAGSSETTHSRYLLAWTDGGGPAMEEFPDAPVGLYSKVTLAMIGGGYGEYAYKIRGTWTHDSMTKPYEIEDKTPLIFVLDCTATLSAGGAVTLAIQVDLENAISEIDFENLKDEDGKLELKDGPQLMAFRDRLKRAFKVEDSWSATRPVRPGPRTPHSSSGGTR